MNISISVASHCGIIFRLLLFSPFWSKYFPQKHVLKHPRSIQYHMRKQYISLLSKCLKLFSSERFGNHADSLLRQLILFSVCMEKLQNTRKNCYEFYYCRTSRHMAVFAIFVQTEHIRRSPTCTYGHVSLSSFPSETCFEHEIQRKMLHILFQYTSYLCLKSFRNNYMNLMLYFRTFIINSSS